MGNTLNSLIGKKLIKIRPITKKERGQEGWEPEHNSATSVLEFEDGTLIYPSSDDEGNGAGTLFGKNKDGTTFYVWAKEVIK